ncbi:hypothetical protein FRC14_000161 [Serendipita sp. 396]|nr:hypothetical protein FRC14_000161 [Serendipita sp. 396]KAG8776072.1 hypothetical protein FRC15_012142 [Serendipita sp. 397]KAG8792381.1 hypothetical protein FRC16_011432 [Serendipita sp. 398]KAG8832094.1 hypothetical protein FRC18_005503 [Serendipita sp. 400]KAG8858668.1 hypothetical protein FRC20_011970 [Serendipita sp. 405]
MARPPAPEPFCCWIERAVVKPTVPRVPDIDILELSHGSSEHRRGRARTPKCHSNIPERVDTKEELYCLFGQTFAFEHFDILNSVNSHCARSKNRRMSTA